MLQTSNLIFWTSSLQGKPSRGRWPEFSYQAALSSSCGKRGITLFPLLRTYGGGHVLFFVCRIIRWHVSCLTRESPRWADVLVRGLRVATKLVHKADSTVYLLGSKLLGCNLFPSIVHKAHTFSMNMVDAASSIGKDISSLCDEKPCARAGKQITIKKRLRVKRAECNWTMRGFLRAEQSKRCFSVWAALRRALQKQTLV